MGHPTLQLNAFLRGGKPRKGAGESRQGTLQMMGMMVVKASLISGRLSMSWGMGGGGNTLRFPWFVESRFNGQGVAKMEKWINL